MLQALDGVVHVVGEVDVLFDRLEQIALLALAQLVVVGSSRRHRSAGRASAHVGMMPENLIGLGVGVDVVGFHVPPAVSAMTIETEPFGPITSFTKKAVSLIIGPQPASYQPTEPSSNCTCSMP